RINTGGIAGHCNRLTTFRSISAGMKISEAAIALRYWLMFAAALLGWILAEKFTDYCGKFFFVTQGKILNRNGFSTAPPYQIIGGCISNIHNDDAFLFVIGYASTS